VAGVVNSLIAAEYAAGASVSELAERWGIDPRQVIERITAASHP
jgi:3-hydroxyisobutyrate dehydrogenase-like beta-hydroxyacid dehydrogenase